MNNLIKNIVIVGGGSAGWLTAAIIAAEFPANAQAALRITLVESPDVKTIGVGEGTWPSMRVTLRKIGISEVDLIRYCSASFKQGSEFVGWKTGAKNDSYLHPFTIPNGYTDSNLFAAWQAAYADKPFAEVVSIQGQLMKSGRAPKQVTTPEYAGVINYSYHFDAGKFGELLKSHCIKNLGVKHIVDHVGQVTSDAHGYIEALHTRQSGLISGDLFIDCTGSNCLLLGQHYGVPFIDKKNSSINDCAIATQIPYLEESATIASTTIATAQTAGWTWDIGLSSRRGVGYVYSSSHITDEAAQQELKNYVAKSIGPEKADAITIKKLPIRAGYREKLWFKNCVAIGMSAGFIEPLEASALALVELSANMIRDELPFTRDSMELVAQRFNSVFLYRWERIIDFLKLHYVLTSRSDTAYWRDVSRPDSMSDHLRDLLSLWRHRPPYYHDLIQTEEVFPSASYQYVLYGMGFKPAISGVNKVSDYLDVGLHNIKDNLAKYSKYLSALPSNRALIEHIIHHGMPKV